MATKPGSGGNSKTPTPSRDSGFGQDRQPHYIPGRVQERIERGDNNTVSRVQPRRDGGGNGSGSGGSNGR
ncbi:Uncharacterised protein [Achromobacter sp. 2789STDY5608615]|nr:Uncharacterised protein [Achromobacter sp. 2789STDY5608615]